MLPVGVTKNAYSNVNLAQKVFKVNLDPDAHTLT